MAPQTFDQLAGRRVLAVCAHPDDESFGLGAVISTLVDLGAEVSVLCLTRGEASTLGSSPDLATTRVAELESAALALGIRCVTVGHHADGALPAVPLELLVTEVEAELRAARADLMLAFDEGGITGHPDHERATQAAVAVGVRRGVPVLAWAIAHRVAASLLAEFGVGFVGRDESDIDLVMPVARERQWAAIRCHASQSSENPVLRRRMALQDDVESLRWLVRPSS